ncbi:MAG: hypothetical protein Q4F45_01970, partial [Alistipes sp.]|nr:hypothetical protein [Alistipes sp.]
MQNDLALYQKSKDIVALNKSAPPTSGRGSLSDRKVYKITSSYLHLSSSLPVEQQPLQPLEQP